NPETAVVDEAECPVLLATGSEPIAGSTRMKAGTAQRIALILLSSLVMIRLGRVYGGLMVDVQAANAKLARRSQSMLRQLTGRGREDICDALEAADGSVKLAALLLEGCELAEAKALLERAGGQLRVALAAVEPRARATVVAKKSKSG